MTTISRRFFPRKGIHAGDKWRVCFWDGETNEQLSALKGVAFDNERDAIDECELQNLANDIRGYFRDLPEFRIAVRDVCELWQHNRGDDRPRRSIVIYSVKDKKAIPLFACGVGDEANARAVQFAEMVQQSRIWGFAPAMPRPEGEPEPPDVYQVSLWSNFAAIEGRLDEAIELLHDAAAILEIARGKSEFESNADGMEHFVERIRDTVKQLEIIADGDDRVEHDLDFVAFLNSFGLKRFNDKFFDDEENEISFIEGYEKYCNKDEGAPMTMSESAFIARLNVEFDGEGKDEDDRDADGDPDIDDTARLEVQNDLDALPHISPDAGEREDDPEAVSIDDTVARRRGCGLEFEQELRDLLPRDDDDE